MFQNVSASIATIAVSVFTSLVDRRRSYGCYLSDTTLSTRYHWRDSTRQLYAECRHTSSSKIVAVDGADKLAVLVSENTRRRPGKLKASKRT